VVRGRFCRACGTRLSHEASRRPQTVNVKPGTLDDTSWLWPVAHIWLASAQPWFAPPHDALAFPGQPPDRQVLTDRFRALMVADDGAKSAG
jgi:hypothetical protein